MSNKKKKPLSLASIVNSESKKPINWSTEEDVAPITLDSKAGKLLEVENPHIVEKVATTISIPLVVKDQLEQILFSERKSKKSQNDLLLEGLDFLFKDRGFPSIKKLLENASDSVA